MNSNRATFRNGRQMQSAHHASRGSRLLRGAGLFFALLASGVCGAAPAGVPDNPSQENRMWMTVGERRFAITLAETAAARAFAAMLPLTIDMPDLNGNEKHADLARALPADASRPGTIRNGDLMLYGSKTLVVFYLTFDSPYAYTRIGRAEDPAALADALGRGTARITFRKSTR